jgi:hypothetical protein
VGVRSVARRLPASTPSAAKNNFGDYLAHYEADLSGRVREDLFGSFFLITAATQPVRVFQLQ